MLTSPPPSLRSKLSRKDYVNKLSHQLSPKEQADLAEDLRIKTKDTPRRNPSQENPLNVAL